VSCVTSTLLSLLVRRPLFYKYLLACSVDLRVGFRPVLCDCPCTDVSSFNTDANWLTEAQSLCALYLASYLFRLGAVAYRGGGFGVFKPPPPKFRKYRWRPRSHKQEEPASRFPFVVNCVLPCGCNLLNKGFF